MFGKRLFGLAAVVLLVAGCSVLRGLQHGVSGVPESVPSAYDAIQTEYDRLANQELADIAAGNVLDAAGVVDPDAVIKQETLRADRQARIDSVHQLFDSLRQYDGVVKGAAPGASVEEAAKTRAAILDALTKKLTQARTEAAAAKKTPVVK